MNEKYDAFISYAHSADGTLAPPLQQGLQVFAKPWNKRRALRVFRDDASLSANPDLWSSIETALLGSRWLILLASPPSASSHWVEREVDTWCRNKPPENILVALTDGDIQWDATAATFDAARTSSLPAAARLAIRVEPRMVDLRWTRAAPNDALTLRDQRFAAAVADLAAPLHNLPKDELIGEDRRQHQKQTRWRRAMVSGLVLLTIVSLVASFFAVAQRNQAQHRAATALSRQLAAQSAEQSDKTPALAALLAVEAYRREPTAEAYRALLDAVGQPYVARVLHGEPIAASGFAITPYETSVSYSSDGQLMAAAGIRGHITIWDTETGRAVAAIQAAEFNAQLALSRERLVVYESENRFFATYDPRKGTKLSDWATPPEGTMSADGSTIVADPKATNVLEIWNTTTRNVARATLTAAITAVGVRRDGADIAVIAGGRLARFDRTGRALGSVAAPATVNSKTLTISDDGRVIAAFNEEPGTSTRDPLTVTLIDGVSGNTATVKTELAEYGLARFSPDGSALALSDGIKVQLVDVKAAKVASDVISVPDGSAGLAFEPKGTRVATSSRSGEVYLYDFGVRQSLITALDTKGAIVAATPDREHVAVMTDDALTVIDGRSGARVGASIVLADAKDEPHAVAFMPSGDAVAVLAGEQLSAYDTGTGRRLGAPVTIECGFSRAMSFDGRFARVYHAPDVVTVVDVHAGRAERRSSCPSPEPFSADVDSTGRFAVFAIERDTKTTQLALWDTKRDRTITEAFALTGDGAYENPTVSPGGRFVVAIMTLRLSNRVFDLGSEPAVVGVIEEPFVTEGAAFSVDGSTIALASGSKMMLYELATAKTLGTVSNLPGSVSNAVIAPDRSTVIVSGYETDPATATRLTMIDVRPKSLIDAACAIANRNLTVEEEAFYLGAVARRPTCPQFPLEPRSLQKRTDIPVATGTPPSTSTTRPGTTLAPSTTRTVTTTRAPSSTATGSTTRAPSSTATGSTTRPRSTTAPATTRSSTTTRR